MASGSVVSHPPPESPTTAAKRPKVEVVDPPPILDEEEGPDAYTIFEGKYNAGEGIDEEDDGKPDEVTEGYGFDTINCYENAQHKADMFTYMRQLARSQGFDVDFVPDWPIIGGILPLDLINSRLTYATVLDCVGYALHLNNTDQTKPKLKLVRVKKANVGACAGRMLEMDRKETVKLEHIEGWSFQNADTGFQYAAWLTLV
ncbi:hypothetical protein Tsubulata_004124 [Turnera subulata]|uniref:Uncharacterized protein n=1 Tax=Turnera subulata TaxID=218843 RepID=A0A9Q0F344_9ROSI|nr:hypothetical protein Tsubulata_004124 [Turnera subulata]